MIIYPHDLPSMYMSPREIKRHKYKLAHRSQEPGKKLRILLIKWLIGKKANNNDNNIYFILLSLTQQVPTTHPISFKGFQCLVYLHIYTCRDLPLPTDETATSPFCLSLSVCLSNLKVNKLPIKSSVHTRKIFLLSGLE